MLLVEAILELLTLRILSNSNVLYFMYLQFLSLCFKYFYFMLS